jgi:inosine-uridine nucleoside N-ribohydrolase
MRSNWKDLVFVTGLILFCLLGCSDNGKAPTEKVVLEPKAKDAIAQNAKINLIYDGDMGPDPCDFATLSMLHEYHNRGKINLLGVVGAAPDPLQVSTYDLYNRLYDSEIPIGYGKGSSDREVFGNDGENGYKFAVKFSTHNNPNWVMAEKFEVVTDLPKPIVLGAVETYRKILSQAEDNSVTIYAAGQLFNFPALFESKADSYSELDGRALLKAKLKDVFFMGGYFPVSSEFAAYVVSSGAEYNWSANGQAQISKIALEYFSLLDKPITYIGFEVGEQVTIGNELIGRLGKNHPTTEAYYQFRFTNIRLGDKLIRDNAAFDELALYHVVEGGLGKYFSQVFGEVVVDENGANTWRKEGNQNYLVLNEGVEEELSRIITDRVSGNY